MQNWNDLYKELCATISNQVPEIRWKDLWHNQVNFLQDEHPFPTPSLFFSFRTVSANDMGEKVQNLTVQVDTYLFFETFADTYDGSWNQDSALGFLSLLSQTFAALHGSEGQNYSNMRRIGFSPIDTGGAGNLYMQSFSCQLVDYAAMKQFEEMKIEDISIEKGNIDTEEPDNDFFIN